MIGILGRETQENPKKDVAAAILPNGRILVNPVWVQNLDDPKAEPDPEGHREQLENTINFYKEGLREQGEQTPRTADIITWFGNRLDTGYNQNYLMQVYDDSPDKSLGTGPWHPISEARELIKEAGLK